MFVGTIWKDTTAPMKNPTMIDLHISDRAWMVISRRRRLFGYFSGKTNRLAMYSLCFAGLEFNVYVQKRWY